MNAVACFDFAFIFGQNLENVAQQEMLKTALRRKQGSHILTEMFTVPLFSLCFSRKHKTVSNEVECKHNRLVFCILV